MITRAVTVPLSVTHRGFESARAGERSHLGHDSVGLGPKIKGREMNVCRPLLVTVLSLKPFKVDEECGLLHRRLDGVRLEGRVLVVGQLYAHVWNAILK